MKGLIMNKLSDLYEKFTGYDNLQSKLKDMEEENPSNSKKKLCLSDLKEFYKRSKSNSVILLVSRKSIYPSLKDKYDSYLKIIDESNTSYIIKDHLKIALRRAYFSDIKIDFDSIDKSIEMVFKNIKKEEQITSKPFFKRVSRKVIKENKGEFKLEKSTGLNEIVNCLTSFYKYEINKYIDDVGFDENLEYYIEGVHNKLNEDIYFTCSDDNVKKEINYKLKETIHESIGSYNTDEEYNDKIKSNLNNIVVDMYNSSKILL